MKEKHKFPLIYTSKSVSAEKRVLAFVKNSDENLSCSEDISRKSEGKVTVNFLGLFLTPPPLKQSVLTHSILSGTIETAPTGRTPC